MREKAKIANSAGIRVRTRTHSFVHVPVKCVPGPARIRGYGSGTVVPTNISQASKLISVYALRNNTRCLRSWSPTYLLLFL